MPEPLLIAEVKTHSPFGFESDFTWDEQFDLAATHGDWVSVHTDPRWGGSFDLLEAARSRTEKPLLAKGIHGTDDDIARAVEIGADYVLVVGRLPGVYRERILYEPLTVREILDNEIDDIKLVWNSRDVQTGDKKLTDVSVVRMMYEGWLCQASNIRSTKDVHPEVDAILVGQSLREFLMNRSRGI